MAFQALSAPARHISLPGPSFSPASQWSSGLEVGLEAGAVEFLLIVDLALPTACVALGFLLRGRGWAAWRVVGVCTASWVVLANVMASLILRGYSVSIYALMLTGLTVERVVGPPRPGNIMADPRRVFLVTVLYPLLSACILPTVLAWSVSRLRNRLRGTRAP